MSNRLLPACMLGQTIACLICFLIRQYGLEPIKSEEVKRCTLSPVVVVGCGHSGTSILHMLLSSHPDAYSVSSEISNESGELVTDNVDSIVDASNRFTALCDKAGKRWWVEKTPSNVHHLDAIMRAIPHARVVVIYSTSLDEV